MTDKKIVFENYGINPPQNCEPLWGNPIFNNDEYEEDNIIASIDLQASLQKLSGREREIIKLYNQGYLIREIAKIKDMPTTTVQDIKERAISKLKEMMNGKDNIHRLFT